jgi:type IV secretory pathway VirB2 component (pilin)
MKSKLTLALAASMLTLALAASPQHASAAGWRGPLQRVGPITPPQPPPIDVITSAVVTVIGTLLSGVQL